MSAKTTYPIARHVSAACWTLEKNDVWNVPDAPTNEVRFEIETRGPWQIVSKVRGLAMTDDGRVYGLRNLLDARQSGYDMNGKVSIAGRKYRAFTSSKLFQRPDGSLVDVGILYVCADGAMIAGETVVCQEVIS